MVGSCEMGEMGEIPGVDEIERVIEDVRLEMQDEDGVVGTEFGNEIEDEHEVTCEVEVGMDRP